MSTLHVRLLGAFRLTFDEAPVTTLNAPRLQSLFTYLLLHRSAPQPRDRVAFLLWPDSSETRARGNLRGLIHRLRRSLPHSDDFLDVTDQTLQWQADAPFTLDVADFEQAVSQIELSALQEAVALYRGDLLPGCYDDWIVPERERLRQKLLTGLEQLTALLEKQRDYRAAIRYARRMLQFDPLREETYRRLMRLHGLGGDRAGALNSYHACVTLLRQELDVAPSPPTQALYQRLLELDDAVVALSPFTAPRHNLPAQPTPFVDREKELQRLGELLASPDCRLLTLVGPGGIGKTRLALQAAADKIGQFRHGVYLVPLGSLNSSGTLISAIADAAQFSFQGQNEPKTQLYDYLREKEMLLVLDNFEHLLDGAALLAEILTQAPQVKALVTSRERLNLRWEWLLEVNGLGVPESETTPELEDFGASELFLRCARRLEPRVSFSDAQAPFVVRICRLVGGMPLAIELAAAWSRTHTPQKIAQEIERNLDFLSTDLRDIPERHRSLRAVFAHSWQRLPEQERGVFQRLSVFHSGFEDEAAEKIAAASLTLLASLMGKFMLRRNSSGRFEIHELLRQYAAEKLQDHQETQRVRDRHCAYYADLMRSNQAALREQKPEALEEIERELENVRAAWRHAVAQNKTEDLGRFLESLFLFYERQGRFQEGAETLKSAVQNLSQADGKRKIALLEKIRARWGAFGVQIARYEEAREQLQRALSFFKSVDNPVEAAFCRQYLGELCWKVGEYTRAKQLFQKNLAIYTKIDDQRERANVLVHLGIVSLNEGQYSAAQAYHRQSLEIYRALGDRRGIATALHRLGHAALHLGNYERAQELNQESLALRREIGDQRGVAACLNNLGMVLCDLGEYVEAERCFQQSRVIRQEIGDRRDIATSLNALGVTAFRMKDYAGAKRRYQESLAMSQEIGDPRGTAFALGNLGMIAYRLEAYSEAKQHVQKALVIFREIGNLKGLTNCLTALGQVTHHLGDDQASKKHFLECLKIAREAEIVPRTLAALQGIAMLWAQEGQVEPAVELLALVLHHPSSERLTKDRAERVLAELRPKLPPAALAAARERGRAKALQDVAAEILDNQASARG